MTTRVRRAGWPVVGRGAARPALATCTLAVVLASAAGCTDTTRPPEELLPSSGPATSTGPVRPDPNFKRPHTVAGADLLTRFPAPAALGPGWAYARGKPSGVERDVSEVMDGVVPLECLRIYPMPLARAAAELHYTFRGMPVNAFQLGYDDPAVTRAFFSLRERNLQDCKSETGDVGEDLVGQVISLSPEVMLSDRYPDDPARRRSDLAVYTDHAVLMLEAPVSLGAAPFTSGSAITIARVFGKGSP